jgi:hypothetical protein
MAEDGLMPRLCRGYLNHPCLIGILYGAVPVLLCFGYMFAALPFRDVYVLRFALSLITGVVAGTGLNRFGLSLWLLKHRSAAGPAGAGTGMLIGGAIGIGVSLLPPLTSFIGTQHPEQAKTFVIAAYLTSTIVGAMIGAMLGAIGRQHVERSAPTPGT